MGSLAFPHTPDQFPVGPIHTDIPAQAGEEGVFALLYFPVT